MTHPILGVLAEQGRMVTWLAKQTRYDRAYLSRVFHKRLPTSPALRAKCARVLGVPEDELFHDDSTPDKAA